MLSVFPSLLFLAPFSAFLIRVALALVLLYAVNKHWLRAETKFKIFGVIELVAAISIGAGALTKVGSSVSALIVIAWLARSEIRPISFIATLLSLVLCVSLILTGAGPFAFDLPL